MLAELLWEAEAEAEAETEAEAEAVPSSKPRLWLSSKVPVTSGDSDGDDVAEDEADGFGLSEAAARAMPPRPRAAIVPTVIATAVRVFLMMRTSVIPTCFRRVVLLRSDRRNFRGKRAITTLSVR
ncbi:hypothetical protein Acsp01_80470 [Actinoplanes sp. NBRC 101535]|nr:hypothetical protein Acsp01_80470 [Actinoplanes sp. NBRC 101535]